MLHRSLTRFELAPARPHGVSRSDVSRWLGWAFANGVGELIGLGGIFATVAAVASLGLEVPALLAAAGLIALGIAEGLVVGLCQAQALRRFVPGVDRAGWVLATASGAAVAWAIGMLPSTLIDTAGGGASGGGPPAVLDGPIQYLLAAGLGLVAGPILGAFQVRELRGRVARPRRWLVANALAWAVAMPVVFFAAGIPSAGGLTRTSALQVLVLIGGAGALAGAIHGVWLHRFAQRR